MKNQRELSVRPPAVAGQFYPRDAGELRSTVEVLLESAERLEGACPSALIAPHAGYMYSGPIAASAYAEWKDSNAGSLRVVIIGPAHFVPVEGLAVSSASAFQTPLGLVPVDKEGVAQLVSKGLASISDAAHAPEHSIEVQLPFLQVVLKDFTMVPILAGNATPAQVSDAIEALWKDERTRVVISSDLSHYLDWGATRRMDESTAQAIERLRPRDIGQDRACGRVPICGLLETARRRHLKGRVLDLRNSGDTAGPRDKVVGYGAFAFG